MMNSRKPKGLRTDSFILCSIVMTLKDKKEDVEFCGEWSDRNNRCWGYKEYMEDYRLANGYEWRDGMLKPKIDPICLNPHGIPTNDYNLPAVPGLNMLPLNARLQVGNRYLDQYTVRWATVITGKKPFNLQNDLVEIPLNFNNFGKLSFVNEFTLYWGWKIPQSDFENMSKGTKIGKLWWSDYNGRLKIPVSWSYFINYYVEFFHWTRYTLDNMEKICAVLQRFSKTWELLWMMDNSVARSCMSVDKCWGITIQDLKAGESIWLWALHANNGKDALCWGTIIVMKLS